MPTPSLEGSHNRQPLAAEKLSPEGVLAYRRPARLPEGLAFGLAGLDHWTARTDLVGLCFGLGQLPERGLDRTQSS